MTMMMMMQVLCVRNDLKMGKGKACAQCSHATLGAYRRMSRKNDKQSRAILKSWAYGGQAKVALRVDTLEELYERVLRTSTVARVLMRETFRVPPDSNWSNELLQPD